MQECLHSSIRLSGGGPAATPSLRKPSSGTDGPVRRWSEGKHHSGTALGVVREEPTQWGGLKLCFLTRSPYSWNKWEKKTIIKIENDIFYLMQWGHNSKAVKDPEPRTFRFFFIYNVCWKHPSRRVESHYMKYMKVQKHTSRIMRLDGRQNTGRE